MTEKRLGVRDYKLEHIAVKNLSVVWAQAQRPFKPARAQEIADNFDPDLFDPLHVTKPNGVGIYHICDGQTRKAAIEILWGPNETVPCLVSEEGDPVRAAEIFLRTNTGRRPPSMIDNFKVSVTARHKNEVDIDRIARKHGYKVDNAGTNDTISAVGSLRFVYTVCGSAILDVTIGMIKEIWCGDKNGVVGPMLRGIGVFLNEYGRDINRERFVETTKKKWTPGSLLRDAKAYREVHGGPINDAIVQLLTVNYNRHSRGGSLLKRKEPKPGKDQP